MDKDEALALLKELKGYGTYVLSDIYGTQEVLYDAQTQDNYLRRLTLLPQINTGQQ
jgi:hypothetical protein